MIYLLTTTCWCTVQQEGTGPYRGTKERRREGEKERRREGEKEG